VNWVDLSTTALTGQPQAVLDGAKLSGEIDTQEIDTINVEGLTAGTVYYFQIKAVDTAEATGSLAWSIASVTTDPSAGQRLIQGFGTLIKPAGTPGCGTAPYRIPALSQSAVVLKWDAVDGVEPPVGGVPLNLTPTLGELEAADTNLGDQFSDFFEIQYRVAGGTWATLAVGGSGPRINPDYLANTTGPLMGARTTQACIVGLANGTTYEFRMMAKAVGTHAATEWSEIFVVTTTPGAGVNSGLNLPGGANNDDRECAKVRNLDVSSSTATSITLSWDPPGGSANGNTAASRVQFYIIRYREAGTGTWYTWGPSTAKTALDYLDNNAYSPYDFFEIKGTVATVTGLTEGTEYEFQVKALARFGGGGDLFSGSPGIGDGFGASLNGVQPDWCSTITGTAEDLTPVIVNAPNTVSAVTYVSETGNTISFSWTAPAMDASHDDADGYNVVYRLNGGDWLAVDSASVEDTTVVISLAGLESGIENEIEVLVQAKNGGGVSDWVGLAGFITPVV
jgi:hypothetical protein